ncbi:hypothetical protein MSC49_18150 [Methylosinus sp. C49]|nr:hypothetical protein MSC49_18150 [Methylosinus sp. C49]
MILEQLLARDAAKTVVTKGEIRRAAVWIAQEMRMGQSLDPAAALLAIGAIADGADDRLADNLAAHAPAGAGEISGRKRHGQNPLQKIRRSQSLRLGNIIPSSNPDGASIWSAGGVEESHPN